MATPRVKCPYCEHSFTRQGITRHMNYKHPSEVTGRFPCTECDHWCKSREALNRHMVEAHLEAHLDDHLPGSDTFKPNPQSPVPETNHDHEIAHTFYLTGYLRAIIDQYCAGNEISPHTVTARVAESLLAQTRR